VIKHNANQRYATNAVTAFIFREIAERHQLPIQVSKLVDTEKTWYDDSCEF
jgi:aspartyl aminopeptidase